MLRLIVLPDKVWVFSNTLSVPHNTVVSGPSELHLSIVDALSFHYQDEINGHTPRKSERRKQGFGFYSLSESRQHADEPGTNSFLFVNGIGCKQEWIMEY